MKKYFSVFVNLKAAIRTDIFYLINSDWFEDFQCETFTWVVSSRKTNIYCKEKKSNRLQSVVALHQMYLEWRRGTIKHGDF